MCRVRRGRIYGGETWNLSERKGFNSVLNLVIVIKSLLNVSTLNSFSFVITGKQMTRSLNTVLCLVIVINRLSSVSVLIASL